MQQNYPLSNIELIAENRSKLNNNNLTFQQLQNQRYVKQETLMNELRNHSRNLEQQQTKESFGESVKQQLLALDMNQNNTKTEIIRMLLEMTPAEVFRF